MVSLRSKVGLFGSILFIAAVSVSGQETLRAYADKIGLNIGTCIYGGVYRRAGDYSTILKREFNTIVAENEMKASALQPKEGQFDFTTADDMVKFAEANNMKLRGHCLIWHAQNPRWIQNGSWTRETLLEVMKAHITGVISHFKAKNKTVYEWDVVNEAFSDGTSGAMRRSFWKNTIGEDFLDSAFTYAHRADPDIGLFYNDYNTSNVTAKSTAVYNRIKTMIANGVPVTGVGFQSHQTLEEYTPAFIASLKENFDRFAALGLKLSVTELDIRITLPTDQSELTKQGDYYKEYLQTVLSTPACRTFMIWGFTDAHSWVPGTFKGTGDALIYTSSYQPKPAYTSLLDVLKNYQPAGMGRPIDSRPDNTCFSLIGSKGYSSLFNLQGKKVGKVMIVSHPAAATQPISLASQMTVSSTNRHKTLQVK